MALPALGIGLKLLGFKKMLGKVPWQVYAVIALVIAAGVGSCIHKGKVKKFGEERYVAGFIAGEEKVRKETLVAQQEVAKREAAVAAKLREIVNAENARISQRADDLRLRGAGAAACPRPATTSTAASEHSPAAAEADAAGAGVLTGDWAAVPWGWLVTRAEEHDKCIIEAQAWRDQRAAAQRAYEEGQR